MKLQLLAFGVARDIMGGPSVRLSLDNAATVGQLRKALQQRYPALREVDSYMVAVNDTYAADADRLKPGDEIAIIPPVSGG